jgi:hypothetical protein
MSDIRVEEWPPAEVWVDGIRKLLRAYITLGARVAWCGLEGAFVEPPHLFEPVHMSGGVWAAMTEGGRFYLHAELDNKFEKLSDEELIEIRRYVL